MDGKEIVRMGLTEYWDGLRKALSGLTATERRFQPHAHANHIDFLVWHMARDEDGEIQAFASTRSAGAVCLMWTKFGRGPDLHLFYSFPQAVKGNLDEELRP